MALSFTPTSTSTSTDDEGDNWSSKLSTASPFSTISGRLKSSNKNNRPYNDIFSRRHDIDNYNNKRNNNNKRTHLRKVLREDYIYKKGEKSYDGWKLRYIKLWSTKIIEYYTNSNLKVLKGRINIAPYSSGCVHESKTKSSKKHANFAFAIITNKRVWNFATETKSQRIKWIKCIRQALCNDDSNNAYNNIPRYWLKWPYYEHINNTSLRKAGIECKIVLRNWCRHHTCTTSYVYSQNNEIMTGNAPQKMMIARKTPIVLEAQVRSLIVKYASITTVDEFYINAVIGAGCCSKVFQCIDLMTGNMRALKVMEKYKMKRQKQSININRERKILQSFDSDYPFTITMHECFQNQDYLFIVLDYKCGGELYYHLSQKHIFNELETQFIIAQIVLAVGYLHSLNIVYRCCKTEDILLDQNGYIVLTDFGSSKQLIAPANVGRRSSRKNAENDGEIGNVGAYEHYKGLTTRSTYKDVQTGDDNPNFIYLAPEILKGNGSVYGLESDWWSVGVLCYELLHSMPPFLNMANDEFDCIKERIFKSKHVQFKPLISKHCKSFVLSLLKRKVFERLGSVNDYKEVKEHSFFDNIDFNKLYKKQLIAPYLPRKLHNENDLSNFSTQFTTQDPRIVNNCKKRLKSDHDPWIKASAAWDYPI